MNERSSPETDRRFCVEMLPRVSRTFALSIEALPDRVRDAIRVSYLLCRIIDTIEDQPAADPRLRQEWFDTFDAILLGTEPDLCALEHLSQELGVDPSERELCANSGAVFRVLQALPEEARARIAPHVHDMSLGMRMYTLRAQARGGLRIQDIEDLARYCYYVAGTVGELLTELFELHAPIAEPGLRERIRDLSSHFGVGLQLVNIVKDVAEDLERGVVFLPESSLRRHGLSSDRLLEPQDRAAGIAVIREVCAFAREKLESARLYARLWPLPEGEPVRLFCAVPLLLALATLDEVERGQDTLLAGRSPKVSRSRVADVLGRALMAISDDQAFGTLLEIEPARIAAATR